MALTETVEGGVELSLPHLSLGNTYIELISEVVKDLPGVTRLDLRDNRLTDVGVQEIVEAICSMDGHRGIQVTTASSRPFSWNGYLAGRFLFAEVHIKSSVT